MAIRASSSNSPCRFEICRRLSRVNRSRKLTCTSPRSRSGGSRFRIRGSRGRTTVPWNSDGNHPLDQFSTPSTGKPLGSVIATYAGNSSVSAPNPKVNQLPSAGRPRCVRPVFIAWIDWPWLFTPVCIERTTRTSSTISERPGNSSEIGVPQSPCCRNFHGLPSTRELAWAALSYLIVPGNCWPSSRVNSGLGSIRSTWLGPPCMNIEIIAVARGVLRGCLGNRSNDCRANSGFTGAACSRSRPIAHDIANGARLIAPWARK